MTPRTAAKDSAGTAKKTLLDVLMAWLPRKKEQDRLKKFVTGISQDDLSAISGLLKKCGAPPPPASGSLEKYLDWHYLEKKKRAAIVQKMDGLRAAEKDDMTHGIMMEGRRLTGAELGKIFRNGKETLRYFSTLSATQLEAMRRGLDDTEVELPAKVKKGFQKMFTAFRDERLAFETERAEVLAPKIADIRRTEKLFDQLHQLEAIQKKITSSRSA